MPIGIDYIFQNLFGQIASRRGGPEPEALPHRAGHAEALQRHHLLPVRGHAPHHVHR